MLDGHTSYRINRLAVATQKVLEKARKIDMEIANRLAKKGEDGVCLKGPEGALVFETPELKAQFDAELQEKFKTEVLELKINKLDFRNLVNVRGLQPSIWENLEPILDNVPDEV